MPSNGENLALEACPGEKEWYKIKLKTLKKDNPYQ